MIYKKHEYRKSKPCHFLLARCYRLEFTGLPKMLLDLKDHTESIARSFRLK